MRATVLGMCVDPSQCRNESAFQKAKTYGQMKAPRNISSLPPEHVPSISAFTLSMKNAIKHHSWFAPGQSPIAITNRVDFLAERKITSRDFSSFDGTI